MPTRGLLFRNKADFIFHFQTYHNFSNIFSFNLINNKSFAINIENKITNYV